MGLNPYYSEPGIDIYVGKFQDVMPELGLKEKEIDLVVTDPPYGVGLKYDQYQDTKENWELLMLDLVRWSKLLSKMTIMPCCRIASLQWIYTNIAPDWLMAWYKGSPGHRSYIGFNDWEPLLVYGKTRGCNMHDYFYCQPDTFKGIKHPCPKPVGWSAWLINRATKEGDLVVNPCMGSGTCALACKKLNRRFIGIEMSEAYAQVAADRLRQEILPLEPEQMEIPAGNDQGDFEQYVSSL